MDEKQSNLTSGEESLPQQSPADDVEILKREEVLAKGEKIEQSSDYNPEVLPWFDRITTKISAVLMILPAFIVTIMFYEVVVRYIFKKPTLWVNEMSLWVAGFVYLFAGLHTMQQRAHIRVTVFYDMAGPKLRRVFDTITLLCISMFTIGLVLGSWKAVYATLARWETYGTAWDPPIPATLKPGILIATVLLCLQALSNYLNDSDAYGTPRKKKKKESEDPALPDSDNS